MLLLLIYGVMDQIYKSLIEALSDTDKVGVAFRSCSVDHVETEYEAVPNSY